MPSSVSSSPSSSPSAVPDMDSLVDAAVARARGWLAATAGENDPNTEQLAQLLKSTDGVRFTMDFVDRVVRPEDNAVAAHALQEITAHTNPRFLGLVNGLLVGMGGFFGPILPHLVMPLARARMRQMVGHLVLDARA